MYGKGILKGLGVTLKRFINTYVDDIAWWGRRYFKPEGIAHRSSKDARGIFTIQYPEEKLPTPEEFRYVPFLVYDETEDGEKAVRCTSPTARALAIARAYPPSARARSWRRSWAIRATCSSPHIPIVPSPGTSTAPW